ncbi:MAG: hypothetical protein Q9186_007555 [Xanthomendoza sp. 1 TL-2023]
MFHTFFFLLSILISSVSGLPPPRLPHNLAPTAFNVTLRGKTACTLQPAWLNPDPRRPVNVAHCDRAYWELRADVADFGNRQYEWLAKGTPFKRHWNKWDNLEGRVTPMRYVHETCTIAVAFLRDTGPTWDGMPPGPYPTYSITSFMSLYLSAKGLVDTCVMKEQKLGWSALGESDYLHFKNFPSR